MGGWVSGFLFSSSFFFRYLEVRSPLMLFLFVFIHLSVDNYLTSCYIFFSILSSSPQEAGCINVVRPTILRHEDHLLLPTVASFSMHYTTAYFCIANFFFLFLVAHLSPWDNISDHKCCSSFLIASVLGSLPPSYFVASVLGSLPHLASHCSW